MVVGTKTPESVQRATIRTGVVTREEAERRGARNVGEALAGEPSLQVNPEAYDLPGTTERRSDARSSTPIACSSWKTESGSSATSAESSIYRVFR